MKAAAGPAAADCRHPGAPPGLRQRPEQCRKALMLTWCVTTTSTPGPCHWFSSARACAVCSRPRTESAKNESNAGAWLTRVGKASCAVSRVRHHCDDSNWRTAMCLCRARSAWPRRRALGIQVALGAVVAQPADWLLARCAGGPSNKPAGKLRSL